MKEKSPRDGRERPSYEAIPEQNRAQDHPGPRFVKGRAEALGGSAA